MDYLPEWYSSNVNQPKKSAIKPKQPETSNPTKIFYILKDDQLNFDDAANSLQHQLSLTSTASASTLHYSNNNIFKSFEQEFDLVKQNRIRNDLLTMLTQNPNKFLSFNLPDTFNCSSKQKGFHRDPFDCTKYYFCDDGENLEKGGGGGGERSASAKETNFLLNNKQHNRIETNLIQTKAYTCPKNTMFNMNGCYCEKDTNHNLNCHYLSDTYCDFALFRNVEKKFS